MIEAAKDLAGKKGLRCTNISGTSGSSGPCYFSWSTYYLRILRGTTLIVGQTVDRLFALRPSGIFAETV